MFHISNFGENVCHLFPVSQSLTNNNVKDVARKKNYVIIFRKRKKQIHLQYFKFEFILCRNKYPDTIVPAPRSLSLLPPIFNVNDSTNRD